MKTDARIGRSVFAFARITVLLCLFQCARAETLPFQAKTPAEARILKNLDGWRTIDLATSSNRNVGAAFLLSLLTADNKQINHRGLHLRHAVIDGWLDLANLDIPPEVCLEECVFKTNVDISGAHFFHDLSFQSSVFEGQFIANAVRIDGSLLLNATNYAEPVDSNFDATAVAECLSTNQPAPPSALATERLTFETNHQIMRWSFAVPATILGTNRWTNWFEVTRSGTNLSIAQTSYRYQTLKSSPLLNVTSAVPEGISETIEQLNSSKVNQILFGANMDLASTNILTDQVSIGPGSIQWFYDDRDELSGPLCVRWNTGDSAFTVFRPAIFRGDVHLNGAVIAGKLEAEGAEFDKDVDCVGLNVAGDILISYARFYGGAQFGHAQAGHDFEVQGSLFESPADGLDCNGLIAGGMLDIEMARFASSVCFSHVTVGNTFRGTRASFENGERAEDFSGMKVSGSADFSGARFAGPANFILVHVSGDFNCQDVLFEDAHAVGELQEITGNASTFNADFGSMQVDGFVMFEKTFFGRSVSFRNARFENLFLDGVQWPEADYMEEVFTNHYPHPNALLRLENLDFQAIRDISGNEYYHSREQLEESATNLLALFAARTPYSFDVYLKLEEYFQREGAPDLADNVFIAAKTREGQEATGWPKFINVFLYWTIGYGRYPMRAFYESVVCVSMLTVICYLFCVEEKNRKEKKPRIGLALLYSLDRFLPIVDLGTADALKPREGREWVKYVLAMGRILGFVLVPLWTVAIAGLIR